MPYLTLKTPQGLNTNQHQVESTKVLNDCEDEFIIGNQPRQSKNGIADMYTNPKSKAHSSINPNCSLIQQGIATYHHKVRPRANQCDQMDQTNCCDESKIKHLFLFGWKAPCPQQGIDICIPTSKQTKSLVGIDRIARCKKVFDQLI